ncbi:MAG: hypothetical protein RL329_3946, partial [Bacteroidota bacterium]
MGQKWWKGGVFVRSTVRNKYLKILLTTRALTTTRPRNPTQRLDAGGCALVQSFSTIFCLYIILNWLFFIDLRLKL